MAKRTGQRRENSLPVNRAISQVLFPAPVVRVFKGPAKLVPRVPLKLFTPSRLSVTVPGSGQSVRSRAYGSFSLSDPSPRSGRREAFSGPAVGTVWSGRTKGRVLDPGCVAKTFPRFFDVLDAATP